MQINGTVMSVAMNTKIQKQGGGTYDAWELVYRSPENEVKQLAKPIQSLKFTKGLKESLESLKPNDEFSADLGKNDKGYWEVVELVKGQKAEASAEGDKPQPSGVMSSAPERPVHAQRAVNRVVGSTYETPEERAKRQVVIVKQSCLAQAVAFITAQKTDIPVTKEDVVDLAEFFDKFVNKGLKAAAKKYLEVELNDEDNAGV